RNQPGTEQQVDRGGYVDGTGSGAAAMEFERATAGSQGPVEYGRYLRRRLFRQRRHEDRSVTRPAPIHGDLQHHDRQQQQLVDHRCRRNRVGAAVQMTCKLSAERGNDDDIEWWWRISIWLASWPRANEFNDPGQTSPQRWRRILRGGPGCAGHLHRSV